MKHIVVLSDTHGFLDSRLIKYFKKADEIWHAGDIGSIEVIEKLKKYCKVRAVWGNIDNYKTRQILNKYLIFKCESKKIIITHSSGLSNKYSKEILMLIQKEKPDIFVCGHSHILKILYEKKHDLLHINPGAIGNHGIHKVKTIVCFDLNDEKIKNLNVIEIPRQKLTNPIC